MQMSGKAFAEKQKARTASPQPGPMKKLRSDEQMFEPMSGPQQGRLSECFQNALAVLEQYMTSEEIVNTRSLDAVLDNTEGLRKHHQNAHKAAHNIIVKDNEAAHAELCLESVVGKPITGQILRLPG